MEAGDDQWKLDVQLWTIGSAGLSIVALVYIILCACRRARASQPRALLDEELRV